MKKFTLSTLFMAAVLSVVLLVNQIFAQTVITSGTVYTSGTSFSVPNGYKVVKVEAWGGGGGGERNSTQCGDGGGGGGYACINLDGSLAGPVTFNVTIGVGGAAASGEIPWAALAAPRPCHTAALGWWRLPVAAAVGTLAPTLVAVMLRTTAALAVREA